MEHSTNTGYPWGLDDYDACSRVWQRVSPQAVPYPAPAEEVPADPPAVNPPSVTPSVVQPPSGPAPCCMGEEAQGILPLLEELAAREQALAHQAMGLSRLVCHRDAIQALCHAAHSGQDAARRLMAAVFLTSGAAPCAGPVYIRPGAIPRLPLPDALRGLYHQLACLSDSYNRASESLRDPCLSGLLLELSSDASQRARILLELTGRILCRKP